MTNSEKLEAIYRLVKQFGKEGKKRGGYYTYTYQCGACPITAYTEDEGWTHGIFVPGMLDCWYTHSKEVEFASTCQEWGAESLDSLYKVAIKR